MCTDSKQFQAGVGAGSAATSEISQEVESSEHVTGQIVMDSDKH